MTKDEVKKLWMDSPESLQFLNNATKFYALFVPTEAFKWNQFSCDRPFVVLTLD